MDDADTYYLGEAYECWYGSNPAQFYYNLTEDIIDNRQTEIRTRINQIGPLIEYPGYIRKCVTHFTPNKKEEKKDTKWLGRYQVPGTIKMQNLWGGDYIFLQQLR